MYTSSLRIIVGPNLIEVLRIYFFKGGRKEPENSIKAEVLRKAGKYHVQHDYARHNWKRPLANL